MAIDLTDKIFHDTDAARVWVEGSRWPSGPFCLTGSAMESSHIPCRSGGWQSAS